MINNEAGDTPSRNNDLRDLVDEKIRDLVNDMCADGWSIEEVLLAVNDVVRQRWLARLDASATMPPTMQDDFVSDGNEG
jgi:hypothetical protein